MPNEIERKFLPPGDDWKKLVTHSVRICDELIKVATVRRCAWELQATKRKADRLCAPNSSTKTQSATRCCTMRHDPHLEKETDITHHRTDLFGSLTFTTASSTLVISEIEFVEGGRKLELPDRIGNEVTKGKSCKMRPNCRRSGAAAAIVSRREIGCGTLVCRGSYAGKVALKERLQHPVPAETTCANV